MEAEKLIEEAVELFPAELRPLHFTDPGHCEECRDHDESLLAHTREDISFDILGNPAWDPVCFLTGDGLRYWFPAMVRLALSGTGEEYYISQFLFHLTSRPFFTDFNETESAFVRKVLEHLLEHRAGEIDRNLDTDDLFQALEIWGGSPQEPNAGCEAPEFKVF